MKRWLTLILFILPVCNVCAESIVDVLSIANHTKSEVEKVLGPATDCRQGKYGMKCQFQPHATEIVFINGMADWITFNDLGNTPYSTSAVTAIGLPMSQPSFASMDVMRWNSISGINEVSAFPNGKMLSYIYVKARTR